MVVKWSKVADSQRSEAGQVIEPALLHEPPKGLAELLNGPYGPVTSASVTALDCQVQLWEIGDLRERRGPSTIVNIDRAWRGNQSTYREGGRWDRGRSRGRRDDR